MAIAKPKSPIRLTRNAFFAAAAADGLACTRSRPAGSCRRPRLPRRRRSAGSCSTAPARSSRRRTGRSPRRTADSPGRPPCSPTAKIGDQRRDERDHRQHHRRQAVDPELDRDVAGRLTSSQLDDDRASSPGPPRPAGPSETRNASAIPATTGRWAVALSRRPPTAAIRRAQRAGRTGRARRFGRRNQARRRSSAIVARSWLVTVQPDARQSRRSVQASRGWAGSTPAGSGAGTTRGRRRPRPARPRRPRRRRVAGWPGSRMSCQSVTSSDDRRLNRIRISASAIDASHAATVRITIVKTWPVQLPW